MFSMQDFTTLGRQAIGEGLRRFTGSKADIGSFATPLGDPGLFGPDSVCWRVHAHFTSMMVGGLSSLMVQALHPRALAAVWDHSDFRTHLKDRLGATAYFVAATTYAGRDMAMRAIDRVNAIHAQVRGVDMKGRPYVANEPELIRWVHLVEVVSFAQAYQHLARQPLSPAELDQYTNEMALIGHWLGANDLPLGYRQTQQALLDYNDQLEFNERTRLILQTIRAYPARWHEQGFIQAVLKGAEHILPDWALPWLGVSRPCPNEVWMTQVALKAISAPIQWSIDHDGVAAVSRRRSGGMPS
jgi:uncharacterized protein (DUF2236 family)